MAEQFLEEIYQEAKLLCELRQVVEWAKVHDDHHVVMRYDEILPQLKILCQAYWEQDKEAAVVLWKALQELTKVQGDLILIGDKIEHEVIPLLEERMKYWGGIQIENEEEDFRFESSVSGFVTLKDLTRNIYYHSTIDPMWEAKKLAEYIYNPKKKAYSILGCGLGYLIYQLYVVSNGSVTINVFEKDARIVEYAKTYGVLDWIPEENLNVVVDTDILSFLYSAEDSDVGFYIFAPELRSEPEDSRRILQDLYIEYSSWRKFKKDIEINFWRNINSGSRMVSELNTSQFGEDYVIIAAGPSLDDNMEFLKENKGKKTLVAVGTVFKKLIANGIDPDLVVILDPQARTYKQIEGAEDQSVPMLISMSAYWKFAANYQGDRYLVPSAQIDEIRDYAIKHKENLWGCGGTVTSLGLEAAIKFGAKNIYLVGVDLAYPGGVTHATGTMDRTTKSTNGLIPVEGVGNQTVYASNAFIIYRQWIEKRITQTPDITYYNLSKIGARIAGTKESIGE